jgi:peptidyl-prolyl cis-trans isomerase D
MMRQMRENTKWIMLVTALAFVGLMVFQWGMDLTGRSTDAASGGVLGSVNGDEITAVEYEAAYRNLYEQQQRQLGNARITTVMDKQIRDAAWDQVISNKLLQQELERRGIRVTDEEIRQAAQYSPPEELRANPMFQTNGQFDPAKYQQFMASPAANDEILLQLEAYYRDIIPRSKLYFQSTAGTFVSDGQLWRMYQDANEKASAKFVVITPSDVVPETDVKVTDAQIRDYYNAHKDQFPRLAHATVKYALLNRTPAASDSAAARAKAASARQKLLGGATFEAVARELTVDTTRGVQRTELTVTRNGQLPPAFEQAAFTMPIGSISDLLTTQYGYHVVRVKSRTDSVAVAEQVLVPVELATASEDALLDRADSLESLGENMKLDAAAKQLGLTAGQTELAPPMAFIPGVGVPDEGIEWALNTGVVGEVSPVFEAPSAYYMLELVARTDSGTMSLEEAKLNIQRTLLDKELLRRAQEKVAASIAGKDLNAIAQAYKTTVSEATGFTRGDNVNGLGRLNPAIGAVFGLKPGQMSGAIAGGNRLFVVNTTERVPADRTAFEAQKAQQRAQALQALADQKWSQYVDALRKNAKIQDNRKAQARAAAQAPAQPIDQ